MNLDDLSKLMKRRGAKRVREVLAERDAAAVVVNQATHAQFVLHDNTTGTMRWEPQPDWTRNIFSNSGNIITNGIITT